jgi:hypothetical protein
MVGLLKNIRRKLSDNNQFVKYSKYALGEVLLVVVGILIALQVNNWNENRVERTKELQYLNRIAEDLMHDSIYYKEKITEAKYAIDRLTKYIKTSYEIQNSLEEVRDLLSIIYWNTDHLTTSNSTYRELLSTGSMNLIRDEFLKKKILDYYRFNEEMGIMIKEFNLVSTDLNIEMNVAVKNIVKLMGDSEVYDKTNMYSNTNWEFINDPESDKFMAIESMVNMYLIRHKEHLGYYIKLAARSNELYNQVIEAIYILE